MISLSLASVLLVSGLAILLGLFSWASSPENRTNRIFALLCSGSAVYALSNYLADHDQSRALMWVQFTFLFAALILFCLVVFANSFPNAIVKDRWNVVASGLFAFVAWVCFQPGFLAVDLKNHRTDVEPGPLYSIFLIYTVVFVAAALVLFVVAQKKSHGLDRERLKYVMAGLGITVGLALCTNLILPLVLGNNDLSGLASYFTLIFIGVTTYAIAKHRLFNVRAVVARSVAYLLILLTLAGAYAVVIFVISERFFSASGSNGARTITSTVLALVLVFTFQPLRRFFEKITDRIFYRDRYDSQQVINSFSQILVSELEIEKILKKSLTALCESLHIQFGQIIVFHNDHVYRIEHFGPLPRRLMVAPELRRLNRAMLIADELEEGERKSLLEEHGVRVSMMLSTREEFIGYLLLGDKLSGDIYSSQDVEVLEIIGKELAVAILNARAYAEIRDFNASLQERVDHATNRLRVANRHLKELDRAKDEFISMASHQLRTPLTTIKGYLSMMLEGDVGKLTAGQKEFVNYAFTSSERMVNLISDLLNVSRLQAGRFLIQTKPTDMVEMIADEVRQLHTHAEAKGIQLIFDHPNKPLPTVEIDENKTRQVIMNFIDNAIYYTQKGEVRIVLEQFGDHVRMEVRDTGIGVPKDARKKLFSKFFRAGNAQIVRPDGTGLGLYLAKRVVEDQGGTIIFESVEGKGSTFGFELPFRAEPDKQEVKHGRSRH